MYTVYFVVRSLSRNKPPKNLKNKFSLRISHGKKRLQDNHNPIGDFCSDFTHGF